MEYISRQKKYDYKTKENGRMRENTNKYTYRIKNRQYVYIYKYVCDKSRYHNDTNNEVTYTLLMSSQSGISPREILYFEPSANASRQFY
jgi:hypothetical protein